MSEVTIEQAMQIAIDHHQSRRLVEAEAIYRQILNLVPNHSLAQYQLGCICSDRGDLVTAASLISQVITQVPDFAEGYFQLGNIKWMQSQLPQAQANYERAIELKPEVAEVHNNLACVLAMQGKPDEAISSCKRSIELDPRSPDAYNNLGNLLLNRGDLEAAEKNFELAINLNPQFAQAHNNLGLLYTQLGKCEQGIKAFSRAVELNPNYATAHNNLGNVYQFQGRIAEGHSCFQRAHSLESRDVSIASNILLSMHYLPNVTPNEIFAEHRRWNEIYALPLQSQILPHENERDPHRKLRIGYVSPDFVGHSVSYFLTPVLERHDRDRFHITCYDLHPEDKANHPKPETNIDSWRNLSQLDDEVAVAQIREDRIDILIDLAGHTSSNRVLIFARKPAPIQVTYLGYPNTSGLDTIDYWITDGWNDPIGQTEQFCSERLIRLPETFACYSPFADAPNIVRDPPIVTNGYATFGSFNTLSKINEQVISLWSRVLTAVPNSKLLMQDKGFNDQYTRRMYEERFAGHGITADRLSLIPSQPMIEHLQTITSSIDLCLDPFPFTGHTVSLHTLWMGVPFVTFAGTTHVSRRGVSILKNLELSQLIANNHNEYVQIAASFVSNAEWLTQLRRSLRQIMQDLPLLDAKRFARNLEELYRTIWSRWCKQNN